MQTIRTNKTNRSRPWGTAPVSKRVGIAIHHTVTPEGDSLESVEKIIDQHINGAHPYGSYNYVIDHAGRIWDIVGLDGVGAHAGGKNTPYLGVCYIGDGRYNFTEAARESFADMVAYLEQQCGKTLEVVPHSALNATACPGDLIRNAIPTFREERARSGSQLTLEQGKQLAGWVGRGYHTREYVLDLQQHAIWRGYLPASGRDGVYGPATAGAEKRIWEDEFTQKPPVVPSPVEPDPVEPPVSPPSPVEPSSPVEPEPVEPEPVEPPSLPPHKFTWAHAGILAAVTTLIAALTQCGGPA